MARKRAGSRGGGVEALIAPIVACVALGAGLLSGVRRARHDGRPADASPPDAPPAVASGPFAPLPGVMGAVERATDRRGLRWVGTALRVQKKYGEVHGGFLAGAVSMAAFSAIFPLLLVAIAVAGFLSRGSTNVAGSIIGHLGLSGPAAQTVTDALSTARRSRRAASIVGVAGLFWSGLGVVAAMQYAYNQVWQVHERGFRDRIVGIGWLLGAVVLFVGSAVMTALLGVLPGFLSPLAVLLALGTNVGLWWWTAKILPNRDIGWWPLLPGAILGGVGLEVLKTAGGFYVPHLVASSSRLYGSIGAVFALLAWLLLFGKLIVYSAALNVTLWERRKGTRPTIVDVPAGTHPAGVPDPGEAHAQAVA